MDIFIKFHIGAIKAAGYKTQTMVVVTNSFEYSKVETETYNEPDDSRNIITLNK